MYTPLEEAEKEEGDFNVLGKVTQIVHRDQYMSDIRITDLSNTTWFATISWKKFPWVKEGEVIKIRSVTVDTDSERANSLRFAPHSNIMTIVPFSTLQSKFKKHFNQDKVDKELLKSWII